MDKPEAKERAITAESVQPQLNADLYRELGSMFKIYLGKQVLSTLFKRWDFNASIVWVQLRDSFTIRGEVFMNL